jgi:hypothetical protein
MDQIVRLATTLEILEATKPLSPDITINNYKAEFFKDYMKFEYTVISKEVFIDLANCKKYRNTNRDVESVTIGLYTFSKIQIKEIAKYYKK